METAGVNNKDAKAQRAYPSSFGLRVFASLLLKFWSLRSVRSLRLKRYRRITQPQRREQRGEETGKRRTEKSLPEKTTE